MSRPACLAACFCVSLACGTMYGFSGYAPQLSDRLGFSAKQISRVGMVGNISMSLVGPIAGAIVDRVGFMVPIIISAVTTFLGYTVIRVAYVNTIASVSLLALALLLCGIGATFAFSASIKCAAVNFPDSRGVATAVAMSGYGLSTFVMMSLSRWFAPSAEGLLSVLSFVPTVLLILAGPIVAMNSPRPPRYVHGSDDDYVGLIEVPRLVDRVVAAHSATATPGAGTAHPHHHAEIYGKRLLQNAAFWSYTLLLGVLAGLGQSYIYSCGYIVKALSFVTDEHTAQAQQVAILSLTNCLGRLLSGILSDFVRFRLKKSRAWTLVLAGSLALATQICGRTVSSLAYLWIPSALAGLFYGATLGCYPGIVSDAFGVRHLSSNWGLVAMAPVPFSYILTLRAGSIYDAHTKDGRCMGTHCFQPAFTLNIIIGMAWLMALGYVLLRIAK